MTDLETLFPYQHLGAAFLAANPQALLADDMGLGKSCQAVRACDLVRANNILVLCPAIARVNWEREFEKFSPMDRPCTVVFTGKDAIPDHGVAVVSYDLAVVFAAELKARTWDVVILDEAHYLKERNTKRTRVCYGHGKRSPGLDRQTPRVWRLTGTPAPNNASELWTHLHSAGITQDAYWDFTFRYCAGFDSTYGYKITGHKNTEELKALLKPFMLRRLKEDVMTELPPIVYQEVTVERSQVQLDPHFYEAIRDAGSEELLLERIHVQDQSLRVALAALGSLKTPNEDRLGILESMAPSLITLRRYIGLAKLPAILDILEDELNRKRYRLDKVVLFGVHRCVIEESRRRLRKYGAVTLYGQTPQAKRQANIDRFMNDPTCRVFIGNIQASGTAITLTSAHEVCFLEQDWVPSSNAQAAMRVHRIGQKEPVRVRVFSLAKSVDQQVQETLLRKARELTRII